MNCLKFLMPLLLLCFGLRGAQAQTEADSLELQVLRDSILVSIERGLDENALVLGKELLEKAEQKSFAYFIIEANIHMARAYNFLNKSDSARILFKTAREMARSEKKYGAVISLTSQIGTTFFETSTYDSAKYYYLEAVDLAREYNPKRLALTMVNVAWIYGLMDDREKELEAYLETLKIVDEIPDSQRGEAVRSRSLGGVGDYYLFTGEYAKAKEMFEAKLAQGERIGDIRIQYEAHAGLGNLYRHDEYYDFEKSKGHYEVITADNDRLQIHYRLQATQGLAKLYWKEGRLQEAIDFFKLVYDHYDQFDIDDFRASAATAMGEIYLSMNNLRQADKWLNTALNATKRGGLIARERDALRSMYKVDSLRGRYRSALGRYQRMNQIHDSLLNERSQNRIKELEIQYETEQTEKENLALKSDLELKQAQVERQQIVQAFVTVVAITFIVLVLVVYRNYQRKKKDNDTISLQANELKTLSRFKDGLTSMVVHDMRNPLNAILGFSQGTPTDDKLKNINRSGHQVLNLVNNMLDIQRFEEAKVEMNPELVNAKQLVADAIQEVSLIAASKSLKVTNRVPDTLEYRIDPNLVNRVLVNLLINSVKYSKSGGEIFVEVGQQENANQELIVRDLGHGIPTDQLPYIFNKFWHNDPGRSGILPSTGLGLSFSKLAVEAHGGGIRAESVLHEGTSIFLLLPLAHEGVQQTRQAESDQLEQLSITPEDIEIYRKYLPALEKLEVFEISEVNRLLKKLNEQVSNQQFSLQLRNAAFQGDQSLYDQLLGQIREKQVV